MVVAAVAVIALIWWGIAALVGGDGESAALEPTATATPAPTTTEPAPSESASESPPVASEEPAADGTTADGAAPAETPADTGPAACTAETVMVEALTDAPSYAEGVQPQLSLRVTNVGQEPCIIDVGTAAQAYTITSGADTIWNSTDCQENPTNNVVQLEAGQVLDAPAFGWVRERSTPDTCDTERPAAVAGGATYQLVASIGGVASGPATFILE